MSDDRRQEIDQPTGSEVSPEIRHQIYSIESILGNCNAGSGQWTKSCWNVIESASSWKNKTDQEQADNNFRLQHSNGSH